MKYDPLKINMEKYESTCSIVFTTRKKLMSGTYLKVNLCDIMFMERYRDVLTACFPSFGVGEVDSILQFNLYVVIEPGRTPLLVGQRISPKEYARYLKYDMELVAKTGARALYEILGDRNILNIIDGINRNFDVDGRISKRNGGSILKNFICESGQESPRSMFKRHYYVPLQDYNENERVITVALEGRNIRLIELMHKNQFLWDCIEADAGSALIAQGRRSLKDAFDKVNFSIPVVDELTDESMYVRH